MMDLWTCYFSLRTIRRHLIDKNYGLMELEINRLGENIHEVLQPVKGLGWFD